MPEITYQYEKFKENVQSLKTVKHWRGAPIAKLLDLDEGNFSRYINGVEIPSIDSLNIYNSILEEELKKVLLMKDPPQFEYSIGHQEHAEEIRNLNIKVENLEKNVEKILALLEGGGFQTNPPPAN